MEKLLLIELLVLVINIPFGYWRAHVKRMSGQWFLSIHIAVAIVIAIRLLTHIGFAWYTYVVMVTAFFLGQQIGGFILKKMIKNCKEVTSCLFMDIYRACQAS